MKHKRLIIIPIILAILISFPQMLNSTENFYFFRRYLAQPIDKEWTVQFNAPVDEESISHETVWIDGIDTVNVNISEDNPRKISISGNWEYGGKYTLYLKGLESTRGKTLNTPIMMPFTIINQSEYRFELTWENVPDLDISLTLPDGEVVNARNPVHNDAELDMDIVTGLGAENIVLRSIQDRQLYRVTVSTFGNLADSNAKVRVYNSDGFLQEFNLPDEWDSNEWIACYMYGDLLLRGEY